MHRRSIAGEVSDLAIHVALGAKTQREGGGRLVGNDDGQVRTSNTRQGRRLGGCPWPVSKTGVTDSAGSCHLSDPAELDGGRDKRLVDFDHLAETALRTETCKPEPRPG